MPESSTAGILSEAQAEDLDVKQAAESSAEAQGEKDILSVVEDALNGASKEEPPASEPEAAKADSEPKSEPEAKAEDEDKLTDEELKRLPVKTKKRIDDLLNQRREKEAKIAELEPKAQELERITESIRATGLNSDDVKNTFEIATALKRGDLFRAKELLSPIMEQLNRATGGELPQDIAEKVRLGLVDEDSAKELSAARARGTVSQFQHQQTLQEQQTAAQQRANAELVQSVNTWEQGKAKSDPDWKVKAPLVTDTLRAMLHQGRRPSNQQEAVAMADEALKTVESRLAPLRPAARPITAVTTGSSSQRRAPAEPKDYLDVVNIALGA